MKRFDLQFPIDGQVIEELSAGDRVSISGRILCGRDAVLPRLAQMVKDRSIQKLNIALEGGLIFHTAVSVAGVGPTSSNKIEIESTMEILSAAGIKMHLGKGELSSKTIKSLLDNHSVYAVIPPVTALLSERIRDKRVIAFEELGMEALFELTVENYPAVVAVARGESIYDRAII